MNPRPRSLFAHLRLVIIGAALAFSASPSFSQNSGYDTLDTHWDAIFKGPSGLNGPVSAMIEVGDDIYVGGIFTASTDGIPLKGVARWNTVSRSWFPLGEGVDGAAYCFTLMGKDLYVGGSFAHAGSVASPGIAKWDGNAWSALPVLGGASISNGTVLALANDGAQLFIGGAMIFVGADKFTYLARWDTHGLSEFQNNGFVNSTVLALCWTGSDLYAGGQFLNNSTIVRWNGTQWAIPGEGLIGSVRAMAFDGHTLYVGGSISIGTSSTVLSVARWDGISWAALGSQLGGGSVFVLNYLNGKLTAAGEFTNSGSVVLNHIAQWDSVAASWIPVGTGVVGSLVTTIVSHGASLFVGGTFWSVGGIGAGNLARLDNGAWTEIDGLQLRSVSGTSVSAILVDGNDVYVGGAFVQAGDVPANNIARFNRATGTWSALGTGNANGVNGTVTAFAKLGADLYVAGSFTTAGDSTAYSVARWDGAQWHALGIGANNGLVNGFANGLAVLGNELYVAGEIFARRSLGVVRKWDGTNWTQIGSSAGFGFDCITVYKGEIVVGGLFSLVNGIVATHLARWDGSSWSALAGGTNGEVVALTVFDSTLVAGGSFTQAGSGVPAGGVAMWDGSSWVSPGAGVKGDVMRFSATSGGFVVGGLFQDVDGLSRQNAAIWNNFTHRWYPLGTGVDGKVDALASDPTGVFVGGEFLKAGTHPSFHLAHWEIASIPTSVIAKGVGPETFALSQNYPNPFNPSTSIAFSVQNHGSTTLKVYSILGQEAATLFEGQTEPGRTYSARFDGDHVASGVYIYRLTSNHQVAQKRMILLK